MINTLIVDDEPLSLNELKYLLSRYDDINVEYEANYMDEALQVLQENKLDLVFLDIQMDDEISGLKIAEKISEQENSPQIIFVTAHKQHAFQSFDYQPLHYLSKPIAEEKLEKALQWAREALDNRIKILPADVCNEMVNVVQSIKPPKRISIKYKCRDNNNNMIYPTVYLKTDEIFYIHKDKLSNTIEVHSVDKQQFEGVRQTLQGFEEELTGYRFFRIHTSYLANLEYARVIKPRASGEEYCLLMQKGAVSVELPVSKSKIAELKLLMESSTKY